MPVVTFEEAEGAAMRALQGCGAPIGHARTQTHLLLEAELRGAPSHGLQRLPRIVERIANGVIDPLATGTHTWEAPGFLRVDGKAGLGAVVATEALSASIAAARAVGTCVAAIANNNHIGMLAWFAERAAADGLVAIVLTTSEALVHPWGGKRAMLGTNPIAIGVPTAEGPFVADIATGVVSMGKIHHHALRGEALQPGWALDQHGEPTLDAEAAKQGAIAPFGGAKGYALGLAFELLVASLTGSAMGPAVSGTLDSTLPSNKGDVFIVIDPGASFQGRAIADYLNAVRATPPSAGFDAVRAPGDRARREREVRLRSGFSVPDALWARLSRGDIGTAG
jgi:L-2-hydroxycarboxylate dehydrogenase (NAD+)